MVSAPWSTWNANIKSAWLICFVWLHPQPLEEAFSQKAGEQVPAEQLPQLLCWQLNNEPITSADLLQQSCTKFLTSSVMLLCPGLAQKPWWSVASSVLVNLLCHESALAPGPNDVCWFMTALNVGSGDFSAKRNIWLVSDWSSECKHSYLQRGWRAEPCPRAKQGVNQPDSTETHSEIYFHFWPIFSRELIFCCHTSSNSCQGSSNFSHFYASSESGILMAARPVLGVSPCAPCSVDIPWPWCASPSCTKDSWHPHHCHTHAANKKGPLPLQGWSVAFAANGSHPLTEPHLSKQHRGVQNKSCL